MSAAEEDTELRDLLVQNLENNGVLNKIKAELRAAVFLALEQQDRVENKTPLVNEGLKKFLNTKDGRLVASLIIDFLQVFDLDFTLAVFQPEINTLNGLENREGVARELGITDLDAHKRMPLLLELVKKSKVKDRLPAVSEELLPRQIAEARRRFDFYDKEKNGEITKDELRVAFSDLFPSFHRNILERYLTDELQAMGRDLSTSINFQEFLGMYRRWFTQCRSVFTSDGSDVIQTSSKLAEERTCTTSKIPRYKGFIKHSEELETAGSKPQEVSHTDLIMTCDASKTKSQSVTSAQETRQEDSGLLGRKMLGLGVEEDNDEGDSFFDDPLPQPQKTYGCSLSVGDKNNSGTFSEKKNSHKEISPSEKEKSVSGDSFSQMRKMSSLTDLSAIHSDCEDEAGDPFSDHGNGGPCSSEPDGRHPSPGKPADSSPASLSDGPPSKSITKPLSGEPLSKDSLDTKSSNRNDGAFKNSKTNSDKNASIGLDEDDYDDDFNSTSRQSDNSKSEVSIGEEIEEVSIEGPDSSDKLEDITQDLSISQLSQVADYMEDVS
ncbi:centrosomal protein 43 isoform X2 [Scleropages formosus]|uniref:centrosomal protein 43 isoform X2 n=1 Tax=Scleropages formosus TaxID=113540 RepID=UPI000878D57C|nr:FGFR1 oncogene partner isoform X2 [Scleropages formosus]